MAFYNIYPGVDHVTKEFPPPVRKAIAASLEVQTAINKGDQIVRNELVAGDNKVRKETIPRIEGLEAMHGLSPQSPVDGQTADLIRQPTTLTNAAVQDEIETKTGVINVLSYGAKADGVTDDLDAIHAAISEANGRPVQFPPGTLRTRSSILVDDYDILRGSGIDKTVIKLLDNAPKDVWVITNKNKSTGNRNITIEDMTLDWNVGRLGGVEPEAGGSRASCLTFGNVEFGWITRVKAINAGLHGIDVTSSEVDYPYNGDGTWGVNPSRNIWIKNCIADNFGDDGITTHHSEFIYIEECEVRNPRKRTNNNGIEIDDGSRNIWLRNNKTYYCFAGLEIKAHETASAPFNVHVDGHYDEGSVRAYNFRHIGHHLATDPMSKTAKNIRCRDLVAMGPNNYGNFQNEATPRALVISAYHDVVIDGFTAVGDPDWVYKATDVAITMMYKARDITMSKISVTGFKGCAADIYVTGGGQRADRVRLHGVNINKSAVRGIQTGSNVVDVSISQVDAIGNVGSLHGVDIYESEITEIFGVQTSGFVNAVIHEGVKYPTFLDWKNRRGNSSLAQKIADLREPGKSYHLSTTRFDEMTDKPALATEGAFMIFNGPATGSEGAQNIPQTIMRNSNAARTEIWSRMISNDGLKASEWVRLTSYTGNELNNVGGNPTRLTQLKEPKTSYYLSTDEFSQILDKPSGVSAGAYFVENGPRSTSIEGTFNMKQTITRNSTGAAPESWTRVISNGGVAGDWTKIY